MAHHALDSYASPLATRNASPEMQAIWSPRRKFETWRRIWFALAKAQKSLGLPITDEQLAQLEAALPISEQDLERAAHHEQRLRHDVMAHVHALAERAPAAKPIIHLGATSQDVNCNTELTLLRDALRLVCQKTARTIDALSTFAKAQRDTPCLAFTHFQPAAPTTLGKRAATWAYDLALCLERLERTRDDVRLRGFRGATGTQASYHALFPSNPDAHKTLDAALARELAFDPAHTYTLANQTYPRVVDAFILSDLASLAAALHKIATDLRLLAHRREVDEPFEAEQVGSSAMPWKRNPMRSERVCGLARFVISLAHNAHDTAATQWLERTLDDSSNRRLSLPEAFLALDGALDTMHNVAAGLIPNPHVIRANLDAELPFLATERLMMAAVAKGQDRQDVHEAIRAHTHAAAALLKQGKPSDLLDRLRAEPLLKGVDVDGELDPARHVGLAPRQVDRFLESVAAPIRARYGDNLAPPPALRV